MPQDATTPEPTAPTDLGEFLSDAEEVDAELVDTDTDVGSRIENARVAIGMDRTELGAQVGVGAETVATWEAGTRPPRSNQIVSIAGVLGGSPSWLMTGLGEAPGASGALATVTAELHELRAELEGMVERIGRILDALPEFEHPETG